MKNIIIGLVVLNIALSLDKIVETYSNGFPKVIKTYKISGDKVVLQKETEFAENGDKTAEYVYSNSGLVSSTKWDENRKKETIRYKYKWTHEELEMFYETDCNGPVKNDSTCYCLRDIILNELSYEEYLTLLNTGKSEQMSLPSDLLDKVGKIRSEADLHCFSSDKSDTDSGASPSSEQMEHYIRNIVELAAAFYDSYDYLPFDIWKLMEFKKQWGYIEIDINFDHWQINYDWHYDEDMSDDMVGTIYFNSTDSYPDEKVTITYDIEQDTFDYYFWPTYDD